jgi:hypothetical protein
VFASVLGQVTSQLDRRFVLNAFLPVLVFSLLLTLMTASGLQGIGAAINLWIKQSSAVQVLVLIGWSAVVLVLANLVANGTLWITRLFEGYARMTRWIAPWGRNYHLWRAKKVAKNEDEFERTYPVYPRRLKRDDLAPTRLGNLIRSAESYPKDRYGVDAVRVWSRLYHLLPEQLLTSMNAARASMEFLLVVAFLAGSYASIAGIYLIIVGGPITWFLASVVGGFGVSFMCYAAALTPAAVYGDHIRAAFDLHRLELFGAVRAPVPATLAEERRSWDTLILLFERGKQHVWPNVTGP